MITTRNGHPSGEGDKSDRCPGCGGPLDDYQCVFCGSPAHAFCPGVEGPVAVCEQCACDTLPVLIARAVAATAALVARPYDVQFYAVEQQVRVSYWQELSMIQSHMLEHDHKSIAEGPDTSPGDC
jgi:hypothetical protein